MCFMNFEAAGLEEELLFIKREYDIELGEKFVISGLEG